MWHTVISSLPELISAGIKYTIPLAIISFILGLILALVTALIRISQTKGPFLVIKAIFRFYVWLFRSTPYCRSQLLFCNKYLAILNKKALA